MLTYTCQRNKCFNVSAKRFYSSRSDSFLCPVFFCFSQQQHGSSFVDLARVILRRSYDDGSSVDSIYVIHRMPVVARKAKFDWKAIQHQSKERLMQYSSQKLESSKSFCNTYRRTAWSILFIDKLKIGTGVLVLFSQSFQSIRFFQDVQPRLRFLRRVTSSMGASLRSIAARP